MMRIASWALLVLTGCAVLGLLYGTSFPGGPADICYAAALALVPLFITWCVVGITVPNKARRDWAVLLACPALVLIGIAVGCTSLPLHLHWRMTQPAFERALLAFDVDPGFGERPGRVADYPVESISRRTDNFVDFSNRDDQNGWAGFTYSADGSAPRTVHQSAGDYVIASATRLGPHWFAFRSYHTVR